MRLLLMLPVLALAGCLDPPPKPSIVDLEADKVRVGAVTYDGHMAEVMAEAKRGCGMHGRTPELVSTETYTATASYLFACVE